MKYTLLLLTLVTITICSCKKDKVVKATNIANPQAATMAATALAVNANGFISIKNDIGIYAKAIINNGKGCGVIDSFAVARQETAGATINYNYALGYNYMVNCVNNVQDNLTANVINNGSFDAPNLSTVNTASSAINLASLSGSGATYTLNGTYQSQGSFQTFDETQLSGSNTISFTISSLVINKSSRNIVSGTATVSISGTVKNKNTFSYGGTLIFTSTNTAILVLEGISYSINLTTAEVTAL
jgi:hypothetical protein